ncbi:hypothetical protein BHE74_00003023 [Ensete ventricosum]|nr:hypothetical protein GW17_00025335 [Ensete ventricosum]RWW88112.1 hypothetical protein BHE74_00003023 [Ensete ventricosum]RZR79350.1 hypothetical protein BHM03_00005066 [Ensete ventricosum]
MVGTTRGNHIHPSRRHTPIAVPPPETCGVCGRTAPRPVSPVSVTPSANRSATSHWFPSLQASVLGNDKTAPFHRSFAKIPVLLVLFGDLFLYFFRRSVIKSLKDTFFDWKIRIFYDYR